MRFQINHDWQGNMSTARARVGESVKTRLLLALCAMWIALGLIGHAPWKPLETTAISVINNIVNGADWVAPKASGASVIDVPPFYYLTAAASAKLFSPFLALHNGARLFNALWLAFMLLMVGMTARELWSRGAGRHAVLIMMGTVGLVANAHSLNAEVAHLTGLAAGFYALALCKRKPWQASLLFALALDLGFLSYGLMPVAILLSTAFILFLTFKAWRTKSFIQFIGIAVLIAMPLIFGWLLVLYMKHAPMFFNWWKMSLESFTQPAHLYFLRILPWYSWPALPLALWSLWHHRQHLLSRPRFQLIISFFVCSLFLLSIGSPSKDINGLALLLPLVSLAANSVEHLKRGLAAALNWFGVTLFGMIGLLIWLGWLAMMTGYPVKIKERMQFLSGLNEASFELMPFMMALIITLMWLLVCMRAKQTNKSTVTHWAVGMTFGWGLLMTLWLPFIDSAKSYESVFVSLRQALPASAHCVSSMNVAPPQRLLLDYYTDIKLQTFESTHKLDCDFYLIQDVKGSGKMQPDETWQLIWQGKRPADRKESYRLFKASAYVGAIKKRL